VAHESLTVLSLRKDRSILVLRGTGAGEGWTIKLFTHHRCKLELTIRSLSSTTKAENIRRASNDHRHEPLIYLSSTDATEYWNLFAEIERRSRYRRNRPRTLPTDRWLEFFSQAGRQLFVAVVTYLHQEAQASDTTPTNASLVAFVSRPISRRCTSGSRTIPDLTAAASAIDPDSRKRQAAGVYANFQQVIADLLRGELWLRRGVSFEGNIWTIHRDGRYCWVS